MARLIVQGTLVENEHKQGEGYDYHVAHILVGREVLACRVGENYGPMPSENSPIHALVDVEPQPARRFVQGQGWQDIPGGRPRLRFELHKPVSAAASGQARQAG